MSRLLVLASQATAWTLKPLSWLLVPPVITTLPLAIVWALHVRTAFQPSSMRWIIEYCPCRPRRDSYEPLSWLLVPPVITDSSLLYCLGITCKNLVFLEPRRITGRKTSSQHGHASDNWRILFLFWPAQLMIEFLASKNLFLLMLQSSSLPFPLHFGS